MVIKTCGKLEYVYEDEKIIRNAHPQLLLDLLGLDPDRDGIGHNDDTHKCREFCAVNPWLLLIFVGADNLGCFAVMILNYQETVTVNVSTKCAQSGLWHFARSALGKVTQMVAE